MICNLYAENPPPIIGGPIASPISLSDSESSLDSSTSNSSKETKLPAKVTCSQKRKCQPLTKVVPKKSKVVRSAVTTPEKMKGLGSCTLKNKKRNSPHVKAPCTVRRSQRKCKPSPSVKSDLSSMSASDSHKKTPDSSLPTHDSHKEVVRSAQSNLNKGLQRGGDKEVPSFQVCFHKVVSHKTEELTFSEAQNVSPHETFT